MVKVDPLSRYYYTFWAPDSTKHITAQCLGHTPRIESSNRKFTEQIYISMDQAEPSSHVSPLKPGSGVVPDLNNKVNEGKFREATLILLKINSVIINYKHSNNNKG